jgi:acetyl-CoA synthetase
VLTPKDTIEQTRAGFAWTIPERYNIGVDICDKTAQKTPDALALIDVGPDGTTTRYSFGQLKTLSNQLANVLARSTRKGDRVGVLLPQCMQTAIAHIAILKLGAISLPLFTLFGPDALLHRLKDAGATVLITTPREAEKVAQIRADLPDLKTILTTDDLTAQLPKQSVEFTPADTSADDPAILIYTSGTTGPPKGALHAHRVLLGHLPGVEMSHDFFPQPGDRIWTPADWAWIGGLLDVLMPALHHGVPVVACRFDKFTAEAAFALMAEHQIRNAFLPPTALKMMRQATQTPPVGLRLRSVASGGETLGASLIEWGQTVLNTTINEFYGQTECNMIVSSCAALAPAEPGVMGFPVPGHDVAVIDPETGAICDTGQTGQIAVRHPDPVMFLRYWNTPEATARKFVETHNGRWLLTGDEGQLTPSGRIKFLARDDDVITSAGYRIGPGEVEDCLLTHPAVALAGVVAAPDETRGAAVAAFIVLAKGHAPSDSLKTDIAAYVKTRLAAHEYPRRIAFVSELPMTTTGKIIRAQLRERLV